ncbi:unnamed protein product, partial [Discosporangium mesarthrocarpum]
GNKGGNRRRCYYCWGLAVGGSMVCPEPSLSRTHVFCYPCLGERHGEYGDFRSLVGKGRLKWECPVCYANPPRKQARTTRLRSPSRRLANRDKDKGVGRGGDGAG